MLIQATAEVESTMPAGEACQFDPEATAHIMGILSNMYSNATRATLREYACNAWDAHVAAGNVETPIEVTLPSPIDPTLTITDHGIGLSREDIVGVYSRYGASTKRGSNSQIGAFGIGAKAAFTVASQFTVVAIKDGVRTSVLFSTSETEAPTYLILNEEPTTEANGVTIQVATSGNFTTWAREAVSLFSTWPSGTVLVNGAEPENLFGEAKRMTDSVWMVKEESDTCYPIVVMGKVAYPMRYELAEKVAALLPKHMRGIAKSGYALIEVPLGSVDISPTREDLRDTNRTITAIASVLLEAAESVLDAIDAEFALIDDTTEQAIFLVAKNDELEHFNLKMKQSLRVDFPKQDVYLRSYLSRERMTVTYRQDITPDVLLNRIWITGTDAELAKAGRLVNRWRNDFAGGGKLPQVTLIPEGFESGWFHLVDAMRAVDAVEFYEEARKLAPIKPRSATAEMDVIYHVVDPNDPETRSMSVADILSSGLDLYTGDGSSARKFLVGESVLLVYTTGSQTDKAMFRRLGVDHLPDINDLLRVKIAERVASIDPADIKRLGARLWRQKTRNAMSSRYALRDRIRKFASTAKHLNADAAEIVNPLIDLFADNPDDNDEDLDFVAAMISAYRSFGGEIVLPEPTVSKHPMSDMVSTIICNMNHYSATPEEFVAVVNALAATRIVPLPQD